MQADSRLQAFRAMRRSAPATTTQGSSSRGLGELREARRHQLSRRAGRDASPDRSPSPSKQLAIEGPTEE